MTKKTVTVYAIGGEPFEFEADADGVTRIPLLGGTATPSMEELRKINEARERAKEMGLERKPYDPYTGEPL